MKYDDAASPTMRYVVRRAKRISLAAAALVAGVVYVWVAAVRAAPGVRRRKEAARPR
jgi:hypothetical protein